ncbi:hypothetical protein GCM10027268_11630 [Brachybacterium huguangmaarense]
MAQELGVDDEPVTVGGLPGQARIAEAEGDVDVDHEASLRIARPVLPGRPSRATPTADADGFVSRVMS